MGNSKTSDRNKKNVHRNKNEIRQRNRNNAGNDEYWKKRNGHEIKKSQRPGNRSGLPSPGVATP